jgi:hypothetical protein
LCRPIDLLGFSCLIALETNSSEIATKEKLDPADVGNVQEPISGFKFSASFLPILTKRSLRLKQLIEAR